MKHHEIAGAMPGLKYDAVAALDEAEAMIDKLATVPAGHPEASALSQKIKSSLGRIRTSLDRVQPDQDGDFGREQPSGGKVVGDSGNADNLKTAGATGATGGVTGATGGTGSTGATGAAGTAKPAARD